VKGTTTFDAGPSLDICIGTCALSGLSMRFYRQGEYVADATHGLDRARCSRIALQFAPQPQDLDVDATIEDVFVESSCLKQMLARERALRCFEKGQQQGIFTLGQRDRCSLGIEESSSAAFKLPAVKSVSAAFRIAGSREAAHFLPPQNRPDPCE